MITTRMNSTRLASGFAQIPNYVLQSTAISVDARMILALCATFREGWTVRPAHIRHLLGLGRHRWLKARKELEQLGCFSQEPLRGPSGKVVEWQIFLDWPNPLLCGEQFDPAKPLSEDGSPAADALDDQPSENQTVDDQPSENRTTTVRKSDPSGSKIGPLNNTTKYNKRGASKNAPAKRASAPLPNEGQGQGTSPKGKKTQASAKGGEPSELGLEKQEAVSGGLSEVQALALLAGFTPFLKTRVREGRDFVAGGKLFKFGSPEFRVLAQVLSEVESGKAVQ